MHYLLTIINFFVLTTALASTSQAPNVKIPKDKQRLLDTDMCIVRESRGICQIALGFNFNETMDTTSVFGWILDSNCTALITPETIAQGETYFDNDGRNSDGQSRFRPGENVSVSSFIWPNPSGGQIEWNHAGVWYRSSLADGVEVSSVRNPTPAQRMPDLGDKCACRYGHEGGARCRDHGLCCACEFRCSVKPVPV